MNEYESFKKIKIIHRTKNLTAHFPSEQHFYPWIFTVTCRFRILNILSCLKSMVKYIYWDGVRGAYLAQGLLVNDPGTGSQTRRGGGNVPGIPGAWATRNFTYRVRGLAFEGMQY